MIQTEHLNLHQVQLKRGERWMHDSSGLFFAFGQQGEGVSLSAKAPLSIGRGDVLVGSNRAAVIAASTAALVFWVFSMCLKQLLPLFTVGEIPLLEPLDDRLKATRLIPAASHIARQCHELLGEVSAEPDLGHRSQLLRIAAVVLTDEFRALQRGPEGLDPTERHLVQAFERLSTDEFLALPVSDLSRRFGCSRRHLSRLFQQYLNTSVAGLRMEMRLLKAVSLLRDPQAKVINVAAECGFNHLGLFNTCFRKRFGASPSEWRRNTGQRTPPRSDRKAAATERGFANTVVDWLPVDVRAAVASRTPGGARRDSEGRTIFHAATWEQLPLATGAQSSISVIPPALPTPASGLKLKVGPAPD